MRYAVKVSTLLAALALSACSSNAVTGPPMPQPVSPQNTTQSALPPALENAEALSSYDILVEGPSGRLERAHIMKIMSAQIQATFTNNLTYHGGPIQHIPKIFVVFWRFKTYGDPSGEATYLTNYLKGIGGSPWLNTDTQYYQTGSIHVTNPTGQLAGTWFDETNTIPKRLGSSAIAAEAVRAASHFGYSAAAAYVVATPTHHSTSGFGSQFCAWHSATSSFSGPVAYTNFPYQTDAGFSCGEGSVNHPGLLDGVSIVSGHEVAETQTDPQPSSGWVDASGAENGDKCAWKNLKDVSFSTGSFPVQPLWDNKISGCALSGP